ncbi:FAD binding domain-containing protein [Actinomadura scrupuli]|uniref:FAD binding domain-containing protein n=1 Tax=Actinomadura scrupuli TaxID=559629 RepID=UPI003D95A099
MITAVHVPDSLADVTTFAAGGGRIMGGGTVVMAEVNTGLVTAPELVSLRRAGVSGIAIDGRMARVGATTTFADLEGCPGLEFLHAAVRTIASPQIRNQATAGGNLFVRQPYGDFAVCLLALDATVEITGPGGPRQAPVLDVLTEGVARGEFVTAMLLPVPAAGTWFYHKAMRRKLNSAAIVTVAAVVEVTGGIVTSARIALGGMARRPVRAASAERVLIGRALERDVLDEAGRAAVQADVEPFDDAYASAWYRRRVLPVHLRRALLG